jgi:tetratricopeptide (TPR) repeat protein
MVRRDKDVFKRLSVALSSALKRSQERIFVAVAIAIAECEAEPENREFFEQDQVNQLLSLTRGAAKADPDRAADLQRQADDSKLHGDLKHAIGLYGRAIKHTPYNAALFLLRGTALLEANRPRDAAKDFVAGLALDPGNQTLTFLMHTANAKAAEQAAMANAAPAMRLLKNA